MPNWKATGIEHLSGPQVLDSDTDTSGVRVWMADELPDLLVDVCCREPIVPVLGQLLAGPVEFLSAKVVFKTQAVNFGSYWHQDYSYWGGAHKISAWIALDDATEGNGCLKLILGSHRKHLRHKDLQGETNTFHHRLDQDALNGMPVVTAELKAGSALFFHDLLVHGSHPNRTGADRFCFIPSYRNADEPDSSNVWSVSRKLETPVVI